MNPIALITIIDGDTGVVISPEKAIPMQVDYSYMNTSDLDIRKYWATIELIHCNNDSIQFNYLEKVNGRAEESN